MCPICKNNNLKRFDDLMLCVPCNHVFQADLKAHDIYGPKYLKTYDQYPTHEMSYLRLGYLKAHISSGRLLDIGCGSGTLVKMACHAGFDAYGNDIHGVDVGVRQIPLTGEENWDVVTFYDSLEHFEDFDTVRSLSARAKTVIVSLPSRPKNFPEDRDWKHYKPGEHLHYFSIESLAALFCHHRLERITDVEDIVRKGPPGRMNIMTATFRT